MLLFLEDGCWRSLHEMVSHRVETDPGALSGMIRDESALARMAAHPRVLIVTCACRMVIYLRAPDDDLETSTKARVSHYRHRQREGDFRVGRYPCVDFG